ncbi:hypothetical protein LK07_29315 [Streptomyces pluripotens]|uniref:Phospholipase D-like domain-containing protein n=1 Tax=Streptomyces pluripotens TaxID=1355015 RepID=A0A221P593_9ACTN|nr:hypothetical protein [Streptomyces pluripotens]ARP73204.1 hypothetical protein LK06_028145 [Streptomyces pluripotens]ASN27453.1 hypothetical protein LK07_29315 [Streptomyces pluripotens]
MSAAQHTRFASPVTLLREWSERRDQQALHEALFLGFTVDLPFLEKVAIPVARGLGARTAVIGDATQGLYDPVDVRMAGRSYLHGLASCRRAFHPKVVLLIGEHACRLAVGSGNPTLSGWGANDELWTVVETEDDDSHALLADLADWLDALPSAVELAPWSASHLTELAALLTERHVNAPAGPEPGARLLHNLQESLLDQLPLGPVDELHAYAPFVDEAGHALSGLVGRLTPRRTILGLQPRWSSYDAGAIKRALGGFDAQIRFLEETRMRHGKFVEWQAGGRRYALTGSPNLTRAALCTSTRDGGNCELAVLAADTAPLLPEQGRPTSLASLTGRTIRPFESTGHTLVLLGAKTDSEGLHVSLAHPQPLPVVISTSPDGSPGSWTQTGTIPAGASACSFPLPEVPGAAVRATCARPDGTTAASAVVFVYSPVHCARRHSADSGPRLRYDYTAQTLFADERAARRFETDLLRLRELTAGTAAPRVSPVGEATAGSVTSSGVDRWDAYLADCRRMIGAPLTDLAFGTSQLDLPQAPSSRWIVSAVTVGVREEDDEEHEDETEEVDLPTTSEPLAPYVAPEQRARCRAWAQRWVGALTGPASLAGPASSAAAPVPVRLLVANLYVQLLAAGVWDEQDQSWRDGLSRLLEALRSEDLEGEAEHDAPPETRRRLDTVAAVVMTLLVQDATFSGGGEHDVLAARAWHGSKAMIARAEPAEAEDLMIPPERALARVASWSEVDRLIALAQENDPYVEVVEGLTAAGWSVTCEDGLWEITGSFGNPLPVVAKAAERLGRHHSDGVLVRARSKNRWAFMAWADPYLVLLNPPARVWRTYQVRLPATPESRFSGGDLSAVPGRVGSPTPLPKGPPEALRKILSKTGLPYPELVSRLFTLDP